MSSPKKTMIAFATRWGTQFGGINSFNQDLVSAFAAAFYQQVVTVCVVLSATEAEQRSAHAEQVTLISLGRPDQDTFSSDLEDDSWHALKTNQIPLFPEQTIWLGHDRITGAVACAASKKRGGQSAVIHHMSYSRYEAFAENSDTAKRKETEQKQLFQGADIVMAVGPLLGDALTDIRDDPTVTVLIPGLPDIIAKPTPRNFRGFISGRLSDDAKRIKQAHLGVAAFADAIRQADEIPGLPDALRGENEPMLTLRGIDFEKSHSGQHAEAEANLRNFSEEYAGRAFNLHALPFTTDRQSLFDDLRSSSVAMMPSWHEGFGLVAWEAIAAGVPLIISTKSGAFRMLKEFDDGVYTSCVIQIDVKGSSSEPFFLEKDVESLAQAVIGVAKNPLEARQKAARLREVMSNKFTWANCARQVFHASGWTIEEKQEVVAGSIDIRKIAPLSQGQNNKLIELPTPSWRPGSGLSDSRLLRAEEAIVPFDSSAEPFLEAQIDWALSSQEPLSVRLLTGAGGVGKTRLALELCRRVVDLGWHAGFLTGECATSETPKILSSIESANKPCCIVIDYAETRQPLLLALLKSLLERKSKLIVRVLLLARDGGEWWGALPAKDSICESLLDGPASSGPFLMPQLHNSEVERREAYQLALCTFASVLMINPPEHLPNLNEAHFSLPLYIQMAALMALRGERPKSAEALPRALINHERRYWGRALDVLGPEGSNFEREAALLMTLATLSNGIATVRSIEETWKQLGEDKRYLKDIFKILCPLYPDRQGLQGLRPDLIGEALVAGTLLGFGGADLLDTVLSKGGARVRQACLTVLARLLRNRTDISTVLEDVLVKNFMICADDLVTVCIETPSELPLTIERAFLRLPNTHQWQVAGILGPRFRYENFPLADLAALIADSNVNKVAELCLKKPSLDNSEKHAEALSVLSLALKRKGNHDDALLASEKCLNIFNELVLIKPARFKQGLGMALNNHSIRLGILGRTEDALPVIVRTLNIYKELMLSDPESAKPRLATALDNFANFSDDLGRTEEALEAAKQALLIYQELPLAKSEKYKYDMAASLNNYATYLTILGRLEEGLEASRQALDIMYELAEDKPERYKPHLGNSINNYALHLAVHGELAEAALQEKKALAIYEELAEFKLSRYKFQLENARLALSLWSWLAFDLNAAILPEEITPIVDNERHQRSLNFNRYFVISCITDNPDSVKVALNHWVTLDVPQQHSYKWAFLILAALSDRNAYSNFATVKWREKLEHHRTLNQGRFPIWVVEIFRRKNIEF